jgi:hypothetical protein
MLEIGSRVLVDVLDSVVEYVPESEDVPLEHTIYRMRAMRKLHRTRRYNFPRCEDGRNDRFDSDSSHATSDQVASGAGSGILGSA